ncbi:MAG: alpha/beta hydrolase [Caulobacteraceae bacterium]|nr:alpha/beta hydrolase [Caulobacter sp.]
MKTARTETLEIGFHEAGPAEGPPVVLVHGFPYDPLAYGDVAPQLAARGHRVIMPYMRGYGPTRFLDPKTPRSGQQAAFGKDLLQLMDALRLERPILGGYDWGGRAACVVAALWPDRVRGLVSVTGYNMHAPPVLGPKAPAEEHYAWYQNYLLLHRGRQMLQEDRRGFCRYLWSIWSPSWAFDDATFEATATSFDNPDFVDVVLHSYRHRLGEAPGDPALKALQDRAEALPDIAAPTYVLHGEEDALAPAKSEDRSRFVGRYERRLVPGVGHNLPQEAPETMVEAILTVAEWTGP